jgi:hypothetical protein
MRTAPWNIAEHWAFRSGNSLKGCYHAPSCGHPFPGGGPIASQQFPIPVPQECVLLAQREHVPIVIKNKYQAALARVKLGRLSDSQPMVSECKEAVARLKAAAE